MKKSILLFTFVLILSSSRVFAQRISPVFQKNTITTALTLAKRALPYDLDNDGDLDIVAVASNTVTNTANVMIYENDGSQGFTSHSISDTTFNARSLWIGEIVGNEGHPDIVVGRAGNSPLGIFINDGTPNDGGWIYKVIAPADYAIYSVDGKDFDGDLNTDIVATFYNTSDSTYNDNIKLFMNNGDSTFNADTVAQNYRGANAVTIDDLNGDNEWDIVSAGFGVNGNWGSQDDISWWENNGSEVFTQHSFNISVDSRAPFYLSTIDLNDDGSVDILSGIYFGYLLPANTGHLSWWQNNGSGGFGSELIVRSDFTNPRSINGADIDGDGDIDISGSADTDNTIMWFENDGSQNFTHHVITNTFSYAYFEFPIDLDGDGDIDIIGAAQNDNEVAWFENTQDEDSLIAAGDAAPTTFWGGNLAMDFSAGSADTTTVFYNAGKVPQRASVNTGVHHVAEKGFYTLTTKKTGYTTAIDFYYGSLPEWSYINNEAQLVICIWDDLNNYWTEAGSGQVVNQVGNYITVSGLSSELKPFSKWTIGSRNADNPLPVNLLAFNLIPQAHSIQLEWRTAAELNNQGFEIWRGEAERQTNKIAGYDTDPSLKGQGNSASAMAYIYHDTDVEPGKTYFYQLKQRDDDGTIQLIAEKQIAYSGALPNRFVLYQNYPNPFNQSTIIPVNVPAKFTGNVSLIIYNALGQRVKTLVNETMEQGEYQIHWDGRNESGMDMPTGTYFAVLKANQTFASKRILLIK